MKYIQLIAAAFFIMIGSIFLYQGSLGAAIAFFLFSLLVVFQFFRFGPAFTALVHAKRGNFIAAERTLGTIKNVEELSNEKRAYYHLVRGLVDERKGALSAAESNFTKALLTGMLRDNDLAIAELFLAKILFLKGKEDDAKRHFSLTDRSKLPAAMRGQFDEVEAGIQFRDQPPRDAISLFPPDRDESL